MGHRGPPFAWPVARLTRRPASSSKLWVRSGRRITNHGSNPNRWVGSNATAGECRRMPVRAFIGLHALEPYDPDPGSDILIGGATPVRGTCPCGPEHARPVATGYPDRPAAWDRDLLRRSASWNRSRAMGSAGRADRRGRGRGRGCAGGGGAGRSVGRASSSTARGKGRRGARQKGSVRGRTRHRSTKLGFDARDLKASEPHYCRSCFPILYSQARATKGRKGARKESKGAREGRRGRERVRERGHAQIGRQLLWRVSLLDPVRYITLVWRGDQLQLPLLLLLRVVVASLGHCGRWLRGGRERKNEGVSSWFLVSGLFVWPDFVGLRSGRGRWIDLLRHWGIRGMWDEMCWIWEGRCLLLARLWLRLIGARECCDWRREMEFVVSVSFSSNS